MARKTEVMRRTKPLYHLQEQRTPLTTVFCKAGKHPLYTCSKFKGQSHEKMLSILKSNCLCFNCLRPGHLAKECKSTHHCKKCQKSHHTLLHVEDRPENSNPSKDPVTQVPAHVTTRIRTNMLLTTCYVQVEAPDGSFVKARALLDSASSTSFVSERLAQALNLSRSSQSARISGVAGLTGSSPLQTVANFNIVTTCPPQEKIGINAIVVPRVTCDLPLQPVPFDLKWNHFCDVQLADPDFGFPGRIHLLLGVEVFAAVMLHSRRSGPPGTPVAFETKFGWVLAGGTDVYNTAHVVTHHVTLLSGDDLLRKFWEIEEKPLSESTSSPEERAVVQHYKDNHSCSTEGRFIMPLPKKPDAKPLGESRAQAVQRFHSLERALHSRGLFGEVETVMEEYLQPVILDRKHSLTRLVVRSEHLCLLHAGPTLLAASLCRRFHIIRCRTVVCSMTCGCVTCRRMSQKPQPPMLGQLPMERVTPDIVFNKVGIDYAGLVLVKYGMTRKPTILKAYICVFVSLSVKAVHLSLCPTLRPKPSSQH